MLTYFHKSGKRLVGLDRLCDVVKSGGIQSRHLWHVEVEVVELNLWGFGLMNAPASISGLRELVLFTVTATDFAFRIFSVESFDPNIY